MMMFFMVFEVVWGGLGTSVWDPHGKENIKKLEMVQRRAAQWTLSDYSRSTSVSSLLCQLN